MLKAGSLLYAIYICLLLAIMTSGLLYVFFMNKSLSDRYEMQDRLIERCNSCLELYLANRNQFQDKGKQEWQLFDDGIQCDFELKRWGMYAKLVGKTYFKNDTVSRTMLIGEKIHDKQLALYLGDFGEELKISGTTRIVGNLKLPKKGYETVNILGNQKVNNPTVQGAVTASGQELPKLVLPQTRQESTKVVSAEDMERGKRHFNSFKNPTIEVLVPRGGSLEGLAIKGNYRINALDTLYIDSAVALEDVIVKAPKVIIEKEFIGSMQVFADKEVVVEEDVILQYPSCVVIRSGSSGSEMEKKITLGENAKIYGGLVMDAIGFKAKQENTMIIAENALIVGDIYCNGILEFKGEVVGTIYAHKLQLKTNFSLYSDVLLNAKIDGTRLPKEFVRLPLFQKPQNNEFGIIKDL